MPAMMVFAGFFFLFGGIDGKYFHSLEALMVLVMPYFKSSLEMFCSSNMAGLFALAWWGGRVTLRGRFWARAPLLRIKVCCFLLEMFCSSNSLFG